MKLSWLGGLAFALAVPQAALADRLEAGARFGDWTVACEAIAVNETICVLSQQLIARNGDRFLTELLAFNDAEAPRAYLAARVPLGVYFPPGFSMRPEGAGEALDFEWQSCDASLCEALLVLDDAALQSLSAEVTAIAGYVPVTGAEPLVFRVGTEGLADGLAALARAFGVPGVDGLAAD